jgi:7-carboxy-7-deazaguanine synthase
MMKMISVLPIIESVHHEEFPIVEITHVIEGEGLHIGTPRVLVRFGGCAVGCVNCDSTHTWTLKSSTVMTLSQVVAKIMEVGAHTYNVSITGGEPLHYPHQVKLLSRELRQLGRNVMLETSGKIANFEPTDFTYVSLDMKTPSSSVEATLDEFKWLYLMREWPNVQVKAVISDQNDLEWLESMSLMNASYNHLTMSGFGINPLVLTPAAGPKSTVDDIRNRVQLILDWNRYYKIRIIVQQHVLLSMP